MSDDWDKLEAHKEGAGENGAKVEGYTDSSKAVTKPIPLSGTTLGSEFAIKVEVLEASEGEAH